MSDEPIRLRGAQREVRDAYAASDAGLFTMNCVAGAGKSVVAHRIAAEDLLRRYVDGDRTPEQSVAVVSFTTDEAADIVPSVCDHLRTVVEHGLIPEASAVSDAEVEYLAGRVRRAPLVGTVDGLLRDVFEEIAPAVGFDETPTVGNDALLSRVHADCYEAVSSRSPHARRVERLEAAYPEGEYDRSVAEMLREALGYCRDRRLSTAAFEAELRRTRSAAYPEGPTESFDDIAAAIAGYAGEDAAARVAEAVPDGERERIAAADRRLRDAWGDAIESFCAVLDAYRGAYCEALRDAGVAAHTDVAFLVASYLDGDLPEGIGAEAGATPHRARLIERYRSRLESVVVDEAQDVAAIQHDALAQIVSPEMRVFAAGDTLQSVYLWRHADPSLFARACHEGRYFGIEWETHVSVTATTTYRCRPNVAAAVNRVVAPAFADPTRGGLSEFDAGFPGLESARDPVADSNVHVAAFSPSGPPGTDAWTDPDGRSGEANALATYVARGLADGTFADADGEPLSVTVLFRRRTRMADYEAAFEAEGLSVLNASEPLFGRPVVEAVLAVCDWLRDPADPDRTRTLLTDFPAAVDGLRSALDRHGYDLDATAASASDDPRSEDAERGDGPDDGNDLDDGDRRLLSALRTLRDRRDRFLTVPPSVYVEDIAEACALRADPYGRLPDASPAQRVADLDALTEVVADWTGDDRCGPRELTALLDPFREAPRRGPTRPNAATTDHDVVFRTIHAAKGDEDEVVALADPAPEIWRHGVQTKRFVAQADVAGLAPPTDADAAAAPSLPPFEGGLYDPEGRAFPYRDVGLRWGTERWDPDGSGLLGPDRLRRVAAESRAESWRLLYVALSRAGEHLLVSLPDAVPAPRRPRDRWLESLSDAFAPTDGSGVEDAAAGVDADTDADVTVNGVDLFADRPGDGSSRPPRAGVVPPRRDALPPWVPRFLDPSTVYPLTEDPDGTALRHLLDEPIHAETDAVASSVPLAFDALGPDAIGTCLHEAVTRLLVGDASASAVRSTADPVSRALAEAIDGVASDRAGSVSDAERAGIESFFAEYVAGPLVDSTLWDRVRSAEAAYVEHELSGLVSADGLEAEIHGEADLLLDLGGGEWQVTDIKISLTDAPDRTRSRYDLQVGAYAYVVRRQLGPAATVRRSVETFGVARDSVRGRIPPSVIERRLSALADRRR
ncbi:UvrD-helicase domain-containing protein [Halorubrum amylolyticum]|uniref:UvrD-helicase domain-containing protein n=1 Tax=Halorubrum amylolyticum TaxID=2508724 RepID=UPI001008C37C|nr:UvrD-helicase domain-containing protein [Halorubrum amylolyticum]